MTSVEWQPSSSSDADWANPLGTDGFEFVEYTAPDPGQLDTLFRSMGFSLVARHRSKDVALYRQGHINFVVNGEPDSLAREFSRLHGPSACAMAFRVDNGTRRVLAWWKIQRRMS